MQQVLRESYPRRTPPRIQNLRRPYYFRPYWIFDLVLVLAILIAFASSPVSLRIALAIDAQRDGFCTSFLKRLASPGFHGIIAVVLGALGELVPLWFVAMLLVATVLFRRPDQSRQDS